MAEKLTKKVLNKEFTRQVYGYDAKEVDRYLDDLNFEIEKIENQLDNANETITRNNKTIQALTSKIRSLEMENNNLKANNTTATNTFNGNTNLEILKRLSNLENMVDKLLNKN